MFKWLQPKKQEKGLSTVTNRGGWYSLIRESFAGAWQQNVEVNESSVLSYYAVFGCITLVASDISKMRIKYVRKEEDYWAEIDNKNYAVISKPNGYQNRIRFFENWIACKLARGNAYILKQRDNNGKVVGLHVLHPDAVMVLVSDSGEVYYQLNQDNISGIRSTITVPAAEIIHDRFNCVFHPLIGHSPIFACGLAATQGLKILNNSAKFFENMSRPSGLLTAPGSISDETAARLKAAWNTNFAGDNIGLTAVLGDDLKYSPLAMTAEDSQLVEQLKMSAEIVCSTFHVPKYKIIGEPPSYNNIEALEQQYYSQALQHLIESIELCLKEGLELSENEAFEFDLDGLLRMDSATKVKTLKEGVLGAIYSPNEARKKMNLPKAVGGETPYLQQQNWSLADLARRSELGMSPDKPNAAAQANEPAEEEDDNSEEEVMDTAPQEDDSAKQFLEFLNKGFANELRTAS